MIDQVSQLASVSRVQTSSPAFLDAVQPAAQQAVPENFSDMITQMITETASALHKAESTSISAIHGQASIQDVVETVMAAEQSLQAAIAVRDKVTAAYLELSRMGI
ncbi:MAG: flagellar hook-basal body complex protein FliE [Rhodomicrobiaceae bacterium]